MQERSRYVGAGHLLYLARKLWTAPARPVDRRVDTAPEGQVRLFPAGAAIDLGNPKVVVFFLALMIALIAGTVRLRMPVHE